MTSGSFERRMVTNTASNMILTQRHMTGCFFHLRRSDLIQSFWIIEKPGLKSAGHTHVFLGLRFSLLKKQKHMDVFVEYLIVVKAEKERF